VTQQPQSDQALAADSGEVEVIDAFPVLTPRPTAAPARPSSGVLARSGVAVIPAVQAAAVAAGGFVAGAAVVGLVQRRQRQAPAIAKARRSGRALGRGGRSPAASGEVLQVLSSRTMLVDVHLLGGTGGDR
jgi:hypothetical protein